METLTFDIHINAIPEKVWSVLWDHTSYRQWTTAFNEGSYYEGTLEEGSIIKFYDPENNGMFARIEKNIPNEEMKFLHLGEIYDGVEVPQDWGDATEAYILEEYDEGTKLKAEVKTSDEFKDFFKEKFPVVLGIIKNLSENQF